MIPIRLLGGLLFLNTLYHSAIASAPPENDSTLPLTLLPMGAQAGIAYQQLHTEKIASPFAEQLFYPPASTLKLFTALAAKLHFNADFHFSTKLYRHGKDLVFSFSGDPSFTSMHLKEALERYKRSFPGDINNIWIDKSQFTGYEKAVGWPWDITGVCYSAPASTINIDQNCIPASIYTNQDGTTRVYVPEQYPIAVSTSVQAVSKKEKEKTQCKIELITQANNQYHLQGCLVYRDKPLPLNFALQNTRHYFKQQLKTYLDQTSINMTGEVEVKSFDDYKEMTLVYSHQSPNLTDLIEEMLVTSDNLIADSLTKALGRSYFNVAGSFNNGTKAIKEILRTQANIDISHTRLQDGSGLSRNNRILVDDMLSVLKYTLENDERLQLLKLMPIAGKTGTLKYRRSMRKAPIEGNIIAKSGSLYGTHNMAGYVLDKEKQPKGIFVQFVTDYFPNTQTRHTPTPITQFETRLYQNLITISQ
ncbi:serine-type D-Ala-D-Ala carboxypeptidase [Vibrio sp.]|nr:serine-type D-Ala-D-Ala carboxypeptidase [Vibrio sp.]